MSQITINDVILKFKDSSFTGDQWEQVASWVINGGGEAAAESARIALAKAVEAVNAATNANGDANRAESYAVGGTGTRDGEDTDNAKYYCEQTRRISGGEFIASINGEGADETGNFTLTATKIGAIDAEEKGAAGGVAELDASGKVPTGQLPATMTPAAHAATHKQGGSDELTPEAIGAGRVNPNLLHNWYFANPVNQRGKAEYTGAVYGIDRWLSMNASGTTVVVSNGVNVSVTAVPSKSARYPFYQIVENPERFVGKTICVSGIVEEADCNNTYLKVSARNSGGEITDIITGKISNAGLVSTSGVVPEGTTTIWFGVLCANGTKENITLSAAKLELGTQQTLAHQDADGNWVLNEIPDYAEQLAICQRYATIDSVGSYGRFTPAFAENESVAHWFFPVPTTMRTVPAITFLQGAATNMFFEAGGTYIPIISLFNPVKHENYIDITVNASGLTVGKMYSLRAKNEIVKILLSADL